VAQAQLELLDIRKVRAELTVDLERADPRELRRLMGAADRLAMAVSFDLCFDINGLLLRSGDFCF
jgi:hypothetical protein